MNKEFCIMESNLPYYHNERFYGSERNEIFGGANRKKSIEDGLVVFMTSEQHRTGKHSFHLASNEWLWLKKLGQQRWQEYYNKTEEEFREVFGRSYL